MSGLFAKEDHGPAGSPCYLVDAMMKSTRFAFAIVIFNCALGASPSLALDLNTLRARHKLPPLTYSATLAGAAYEHARDLARRKRLDHKGFRTRVLSAVSGMAAENVSYGCPDQDCAIKQWARSARHRRNMLLKGITVYGIGSATADNGRTYWVMELGN